MQVATEPMHLRKSLYEPGTTLKISLAGIHAGSQLHEAPIVDKEYFVTRAMQNLKTINIVGLGILQGCKELDFNALRAVAGEAGIPTSTMNRFPSLNLNISGMTIIIFKNGKIVFTGTKTMKKMLQVATRVEQLLASATRDDSCIIDLEIQNMVAMTNCHHFIDLERMCLNMTDIIYEPEQFPAAILKRAGKRGVFLVFSNSKIICLGMRTPAEIHEGMSRFLEQLQPFARWQGPDEE